MADCKDIDVALARLGNKVDALNKKINDLERNCCSSSNSNNKNNDKSLNDIYKRLNELEEAVRKIAKYIQATDDAIKIGNNALKFIVDLFNF